MTDGHSMAIVPYTLFALFVYLSTEVQQLMTLTLRLAFSFGNQSRSPIRGVPMNFYTTPFYWQCWLRARRIMYTVQK